MRRLIIALVFLVMTFSLFGEWIVGEPIGQDYDWTDSNGEYHSIYEIIDSGKAILIFWGEDW
jgi:hypothetical protein